MKVVKEAAKDAATLLDLRRHYMKPAMAREN
jgi:hypothetical protein